MGKKKKKPDIDFLIAHDKASARYAQAAIAKEGLTLGKQFAEPFTGAVFVYWV